MGSIEHEKLFLAQDQFHIISKSAQTNGFSIGFTLEEVSSLGHCFVALCTFPAKGSLLKNLPPKSPKNIKAHMLIPWLSILYNAQV